MAKAGQGGRYAPEAPPSVTTPQDVADWVYTEFTKLQGVLEILASGNCDVLHKPPDKLRGGMIRYADGTDWNPGQGKGYYGYDESTGSWAFMGVSSPLTTKGDLLTRDASSNIRLGVGSDAQVLAADSTQASGLKWTTLIAPTVKVFTANGTYTPPAGLKAAYVMVKAAGGGGGGTTTAARGGGGGEGETGWRLLTAAQIGASQTITIGTGGAAITANTNANGNNGGTSSFGSLLTAVGGIGGTAGNNGGAGGVGGNGGTGGDWYDPGDAGQPGGDATGTATPLNMAGGGRGSGTYSLTSATNSGSGGPGGDILLASSPGADGKIVILEFY